MGEVRHWEYHGVARKHYWENHKEASVLGAEASGRRSSVRKQDLGEGLNSTVDILWDKITSSFSQTWSHRFCC